MVLKVSGLEGSTVFHCFESMNTVEPSNPDTFRTIPSVLFSEVSSLQGLNKYCIIWGCNNCPLYRGVLISESPDRGVPRYLSCVRSIIGRLAGEGG